MKELSLHILDIVQNSIRAEANRISIEIRELTLEDRLTITIIDNGKGMTSEQSAKAVDPFYTSRKTRRVGLGLSLMKAAAERCNGQMQIQSSLGCGTEVIAVFQRSHWDRAPIGDMPSTMISLIASNPDIDFIYLHQLDDREYRLSTVEIRQILDGLPLSHPSVLSIIRKDLEEGLLELQSKT
jgi:hypothetical protein